MSEAALNQGTSSRRVRAVIGAELHVLTPSLIIIGVGFLLPAIISVLVVLQRAYKDTPSGVTLSLILFYPVVATLIYLVRWYDMHQQDTIEKMHHQLPVTRGELSKAYFMLLLIGYLPNVLMVLLSCIGLRLVSADLNPLVLQGLLGTEWMFFNLLFFLLTSTTDDIRKATRTFGVLIFVCLALLGAYTRANLIPFLNFLLQPWMNLVTWPVGTWFGWKVVSKMALSAKE